MRAKLLTFERYEDAAAMLTSLGVMYPRPRRVSVETYGGGADQFWYVVVDGAPLIGVPDATVNFLGEVEVPE